MPGKASLQASRRAGQERLGIAGSGGAATVVAIPFGSGAGLVARLPRPRAYPGMRAFLLAVALFATMPLAGLLTFASGGDTELWQHLAAYVLPQAFVDTVLLLAGVAVFAGLLGAGTAWTVASFRFPGRDTLGWLLPLPLAFPAYIVAYIYVDVFDTFGPLETGLRMVFGWSSAGEWLPNIRSLGGAIFVMSIVLYPYVYLAVRAMLATQSVSAFEVARLLGASLAHGARSVVAAGASRHCSGPFAGDARSAQ
jgi:iron(III) transport system permease protein